MKRRGPKRARVAGARRLAILLGRIWKDKTHFDAVPASRQQGYPRRSKTSDRRIVLPLGEARPDGRARDMLVASRIIPLRLIHCCRPLEQTAMARMMTPVRRTSARKPWR